jgi:hypothetical protein
LTDAPLSDAEEKALADLENQEPVAQDPGRWQMFENPAPLPMVLVVTPRKINTTPTPLVEPPANSDSQVVPSGRRVLSWGLAFPRGTQAVEAPPQWTLFVWSPGEDRSASDDPCPFALPPGSRRTMSLRSEEGGAVIAFRGEGEIHAWRQFVDDWAKQNDWRPVGPWNSIHGGWAMRLEHKNKTTLDVQMAAKEDAMLTGLVTVTPPSRSKEK